MQYVMVGNHNSIQQAHVLYLCKINVLCTKINHNLPPKINRLVTHIFHLAQTKQGVKLVISSVLPGNVSTKFKMAKNELFVDYSM